MRAERWNPVSAISFAISFPKGPVLSRIFLGETFELKNNNNVNPAQPHTYPRRILLAATGLSPQIVTETLYALAVEREPAFVPTEVHIISTAEGAERVQLELLHPATGHFHRLCRDYGLNAIRFDDECIHTIKGSNGLPLDDIQTDQHNRLAADAITEVVRKLSAGDDVALHVSIAGGRKTMGFYLGYALSLFGRAQDRLSHVLVSQPFESNTEFFFPPKIPTVLYTRDQKPIHTPEARITLAEIPFVRLRHEVPKKLQAGKATFSAVVGAAQENLGPPSLRINGLDKSVVCSGKQVKLPPQWLAFYTWVAEQAKYQAGGDGAVRADTHSPSRFLELYDIIGQNKRSTIGTRFAWATNNQEPKPDQTAEWQKEFEQMVSRINSRLGDELGYLAQHYRIRGVRGDRLTVYGLTLEPEQIALVDFK